MFLKNNKRHITLVLIVICVLLIVVGCNITKNKPNKKIKLKEGIDNEDIHNVDKDKDKLKTSLVDNNTMDTSTDIMYIVKYKECDHEIPKKEKPTKDMIGLNREEFENYVENNLVDWSLEMFSKDEIELVSEKNTLCPNHFIIGEKDGKITLFKINKDGDRVIYKIFKDTSISILRKEDQEELKNGIVVDTEEEANQILENYMS